MTKNFWTQILQDDKNGQNLEKLFCLILAKKAPLLKKKVIFQNFNKNDDNFKVKFTHVSETTICILYIFTYLKTQYRNFKKMNM